MPCMHETGARQAWRSEVRCGRAVPLEASSAAADLFLEHIYAVACCGLIV
jgi:hypothetical protein